MTAREVVPYVIGLGNLSSALMVGARMPSGWLVLAATQVLLAVYGVATTQQGFALQAGMVVIALHNLQQQLAARESLLLHGVPSQVRAPRRAPVPA